MNDLIDAVLKHDLHRVRDVARLNPELAFSRSLAGDLALDIAKSSGNSFTHVSLLRLGAPSDRTEVPNCVDLLIDYIAQLSYSHACAGWLSEIEFMVYATMIGDSWNGDDPHGLGDLDDESLDDLRFLLERSGKWPCWIDDDRGVQAITLSEWKSIYQDWHAKNVS
jgi:hypothetical protein